MGDIAIEIPSDERGRRARSGERPFIRIARTMAAVSGLLGAVGCVENPDEATDANVSADHGATRDVGLGDSSFTGDALAVDASRDGGTDARDRADAAMVADAALGLDATPERDASRTEPDGGPVYGPLEWVATDGSASGRTFYGDRSGRRVFEVSFRTTRAGEKRWVQGRVNVEQANVPGADPLMMVAVSLSCVDSRSERDEQNGIAFTQNVVRPSPLSLRPSLIFTGGPPGTYRCRIIVQGGRPRPTGVFSATRFTVESGSLVRVSNVLHPGSRQSYAPSAGSRVLDGAEAYDAAPLMWTAPAGVTEFTAFGSVKMTTCTSIGGGDGLCTPSNVDRAASGAGMVVSFEVLQLGTDGGYCAQTRIPTDPDVYISRNTHHEMVTRSAVVRVRSASECTRNFRIKSYVRHRNGAPTIVHRQGTLSGVIPR